MFAMSANQKTVRAVSQSDLITTKQAYTRLNISPTLLRSLIHSGEVIAYRIGKVYRVDSASLDAYLERSRIGSSR